MVLTTSPVYFIKKMINYCLTLQLPQICTYEELYYTIIIMNKTATEASNTTIGTFRRTGFECRIVSHDITLYKDKDYSVIVSVNNSQNSPTLAILYDLSKILILLSSINVIYT